jgi:hypothetical protein
MKSFPVAGTRPVRFEAHEATPCGRLVALGSHTGEAHYHDTYELLVVRSGRGTVSCAGRNVTVTSGTSVLSAPGLVHSHAWLSSTEIIDRRYAESIGPAEIARELGGDEEVARHLVDRAAPRSSARALEPTR